jgi:hypothetical protein
MSASAVDVVDVAGRDEQTRPAICFGEGVKLADTPRSVEPIPA